MAFKPMQFDRKTAKVARYYDRVAEGAMGVPVSLHVALNDSCFNRCIMCDHPSRQQFKHTTTHWLDFLSDMTSGQRLGGVVETVCYAGGDPLANAEFNTVMEWHVSHGVGFGMTVTGYVPPTINIDLLRHARWVRVSMDAVTPEVYAKVRGAIAVEKVKRSVERMVANGVNVAFQVTLHDDNYDDYKNVLAYAASIGVTDIESHPINPKSADGATPIKWMERRIEPFSRCSAVFYQLYIDSQGDVYPCCVTAGDTLGEAQGHSLGNIYRDDWGGTIWPAVVAYSKIPYKDLPRICGDCIQRLSQINATVDAIEALPTKNFF